MKLIHPMFMRHCEEHGDEAVQLLRCARNDSLILIAKSYLDRAASICTDPEVNLGPVMPRIFIACLCLFGMALPVYAQSATEAITEQSLLQAAQDLAKQYDIYYAAKNVDGMVKVYASDAILISPSGVVVRGSEGLRAYYQKRFASGAKDHATAISEVHVQGNGGYGIGHFAVTVPRPDGKDLREEGNLATIYQKEPDGWHIKLLVPSKLPEK